jgi:hypothetical protein
MWIKVKYWLNPADTGCMEKRKEPRFETEQHVIVTNLDLPAFELAGRITNFSANGTRLILEGEVARGTMVKVEWGTAILLGEIIYCQPEGSEFAVGLKLEEVLYEKEMVAAMGRNWLSDPVALKR